jgi:hypothetical protein
VKSDGRNGPRNVWRYVVSTERGTDKNKRRATRRLIRSLSEM